MIDRRLELMKKEGLKCSCIRCREAGHVGKIEGEPELSRLDYRASGGREIFLSYESDNALFAFLRLRPGETARIRELHVYGSMVPIAKKSETDSQHTGFGRKLMEEAEQIARENGAKEITATGTAYKMIRKSKIKLANNDGVSFHYGVQVGDGGIVMENSSFIQGNVFSNGAIVGQNSNLVKGDIISAGPSGSAAGVHATGTIYAHSISNSSADKDAYYVNISSTTVGGALYPNSPDQATSSLSISDAQIDAWKAGAAEGGVHSSPCPYNINSNITIGPVKINCNLEISGSPMVTIAGPVWVNGNIEIENSPIVKIDSSLGANSVVVIADNPSNRTTSGKIELENSAQFQNSGTEGSYILFVSQNNSAQSGGSEKAIRAENSIFGEILVYAGHGEIHLKNSVSLREASAYRIRLSNSAQVIYKTGLANLIFTSGPSGGYSIESWREGE